MSLIAENVSRRFGALSAVNNVSLKVEGYGVHALIGPNGAGKTTLVNVLSGAVPASSGNVLLSGEDVTHLNTAQRVKRGLTRTFQITNIYPEQSIERNIALAVQARSGSSFQFWRSVAKEKALHEEAARVAEQVGLASRLKLLAKQLSYGEKRQLELALALASQPKVLLLDEPMAGLGADESEKMVHLIQQVAQNHVVLLIEHDMDAVFKLAKEVSVLVYGELLATGTPENIRNNPEVQKAYLGDEHVA